MWPVSLYMDMRSSLQKRDTCSFNDPNTKQRQEDLLRFFGQLRQLSKFQTKVDSG